MQSGGNAPAAHWAAWADALPVLVAKAPTLASKALAQLEGRAPPAECIAAAAAAATLLQTQGFQECPSWSALALGARPSLTNSADTDAMMGEADSGEFKARVAVSCRFRSRNSFSEPCVVAFLV